MKDFGTSESPKSTRSSTTHWCPGRPGHPAFRHNIASSLRLHTGLPYDWTSRSDAPLGSPLAPSARRVSRVASRLPGTTRLRFALHGGQRMSLMLPYAKLPTRSGEEPKRLPYRCPWYLAPCWRFPRPWPVMPPQARPSMTARVPVPAATALQVPGQASLRSRERFWDIRVPKIDSIFDNSLVPRPSWSPGVPPQHRKLVAATHRSPI